MLDVCLHVDKKLYIPPLSILLYKLLVLAQKQKTKTKGGVKTVVDLPSIQGGLVILYTHLPQL